MIVKKVPVIVQASDNKCLNRGRHGLAHRRWYININRINISKYNFKVNNQLQNYPMAKIIE